MIRRRDVAHKKEIRHPGKSRRILRSGDQKTPLRQAPRRFDEQLTNLYDTQVSRVSVSAHSYVNLGGQASFIVLVHMSCTEFIFRRKSRAFPASMK